MLVWPLYGAGLENFGQDGRSVAGPCPDLPPIKSSSAPMLWGLCYSDVKIIRQGGSHPRLYNREIRAYPVVQGHEADTTVVLRWARRGATVSRSGERLALQADVYYRERTCPSATSS